MCHQLTRSFFSQLFTLAEDARVFASTSVHALHLISGAHFVLWEFWLTACSGLLGNVLRSTQVWDMLTHRPQGLRQYHRTQTKSNLGEISVFYSTTSRYLCISEVSAAYLSPCRTVRRTFINERCIWHVATELLSLALDPFKWYRCQSVIFLQLQFSAIRSNNLSRLFSLDFAPFLDWTSCWLYVV